MSMLLDALGAVGDVVDKVTGGRALRGLLGGDYREALSFIPGTDTLGITDPSHTVSGRDLTDKWGLSSPGSGDFGSRATGFAADMLLNPANIAAGAGAMSKAPTLGKALLSGGKAMTGLDALEAAGRGLGNLAFKRIPDGLGGTITTLRSVDPAAALATASDMGGPSPANLLKGESGMVLLPGEKGYDTAEKAFLANQSLASTKPGRQNDAFFDAIDAMNLPRDPADTVFDMADKYQVYGKHNPTEDEILARGFEGAWGGEDWFKRGGGKESLVLDSAHTPLTLDEIKALQAVPNNPLGRFMALGKRTPADISVDPGDLLRVFGPQGRIPKQGTAFAKYVPGGGYSKPLILPNTNWGIWRNDQTMLDHLRNLEAQGMNQPIMHPDLVSVHEFGHGFHEKALGRNAADIIPEVWNPSTYDQGLIRRELGPYALTNPNEFVAEAFAKQALGQENLAPGLQGMYEGFRGPNLDKIPNRFTSLLSKFLVEGP